MEQSESISSIAKALISFQRDVKNPANTADNPFFKSKYAPLNDILNDVRPLLAKNGLSIIQSPSGDGESISVTTILYHESGEWIKSDPLVLKADKATAQGAGSAITYARRYALSAMLGISSEDDDDGNIASGNKNGSKEPSHSKPKEAPPKQNKDNVVPMGTATPNQLGKLKGLADKGGISADDMKQIMQAKYGKSSSKELTKSEANDLISYLDSIPGGVEVE